MAEETRTTTAEPKKEEKQTNCLGCGKPLRKLKLYYRNGKYYCSKKCWRKVAEKIKAEKQEAQKKAQEETKQNQSESPKIQQEKQEA
ncbi:MAG: hypothetical protein NC914_00970 [Candidatus Omnitrophica bacterium]|nr:hypothetical protein [Candidatus Omnitrophota bacterium]